MKHQINLQTIFSLVALFALISLGCSAGSLVVQAPTPTPTPTKTPRPVFTPTLIPSPTPISTMTPTFTPVPSETPTEVPTDTPVPEVETAEEEPAPTDTPIPAEPVATNTPAPPPPPTNTPEPTPTPEPSYPFPAQISTHPTGSQFEFRITAYVWEGDLGSGRGENLHGYQFKVIAPNGEEGLSNLSGGGNISTPGGDGHFMNFEYKYAPYTPGVYKVTLMKDGAQMAPTVEITAQADPFTYAHIDFLRQK